MSKAWLTPLCTAECNVIRDIKTDVIPFTGYEGEDEWTALQRMRVNMKLLLENTNVMPFRWVRNNYKCFFCMNTRFREIADLRAHYTTEHKRLLLPRILKKVITRLRQIRLDVSDLSCKLCSKTFDDVHKLIDHIVEEHKQKYHSGLERHFFQVKLSEDGLKCFDCGEEFNFFQHLVAHSVNKHEKGIFLCSSCGKGFEFYNKLREHTDRHTEPIKCAYCEKTFANSANKKAHEASKHNVGGYPCKECGSSFTSFHKMRLHALSEHNKGNRYPCKMCSLTFPYMLKLKRHIRSVHLGEKYKCHICDAQVVNLHDHMVCHSDVKPHVCEVCQKAFARKYNKDAHMKTHQKSARLKLEDEKVAWESLLRLRANLGALLRHTNVLPFRWGSHTFKCFVCPHKGFTESKSMRSHFSAEHAGFNSPNVIRQAIPALKQIRLDVTDLRCKLCLDTFDDLHKLTAHLIQKHSVKYFTGFERYLFQVKLDCARLKCFECGAEFDFFQQLVKHSVDEHEKSVFLCHVCGKGFEFADKLNAHRDVKHAAPIKCSHCEKTFTNFTNRKAHEVKEHKVGGYTCNECGLTFGGFHKRKLHAMAEHDQGNRYTCKECSLTFLYNKKLQQHIKTVHRKERKTCPICNIKVVFLQKHMVCHSDEKPFVCEVCQKSFARKHNVVAHMKRHEKSAKSST